MAIVSQNAKLSNWKPEYSQLDIDGIPDKYNTAGKLGSLPPGASQLDFDGALPPVRDYFTGPQPSQGQELVTALGFPGALPAPVDNFINTYANGFTLQNPIGVTQFINDGQTSQYGPGPGTPDKYDTTGVLGSLPANASQLDFDGALPSAVDFITNRNANGFTLQAPTLVTQFINDGQTSIHGFPGALPAPVDFFTNDHAAGFTLRAPVGVTQFAYDGQTSQFGFTGKLPPPVDFFTNAHANGFTIQAPTLVSQFIDPGNSSIYGFPGALPSPVDYFTNDHAAGFTLRAPVGVTQFAFDGQTSQYGFQGKLPPAADWLSNRFAKGFTIQNPVGISQFVGIQANTYTNPNGTVINTQPGLVPKDTVTPYYKGFYIKNPIGVSQFVGISPRGETYTNPNPFNALRVTNWFPDETSGAKGFKDKVAPYESGFIGISADSTKYQYPDTVAGGRLLNVRLGQGAGTAKLENQLGNGSKMGNTGFYAENRYGEAVRNADNQSLLASWALRRRSPSPLEQQYSKFKLRDEAFNPTFIAQPLILRGLQNPDVLNPQRWGLDALGQQEGRTAANNLAAALDGGFIRGGASTALERSAIDTARIAKFLASPKGLVWSITQVGLGKSNVRPHGAMPYAEIALATQNPLPLLNNTQTHLGLTSLLSVPGSAFGLHFTRHGIPFLNEVASYEYVLKSFTRAETDQPGTMFHKYTRLKDELLDMNLPNIVPVGSPISNLSYEGGPQSVYGLGNTTVKRATDTLEGWKRYKPIAYPDPLELKALPQQPKRALGFDTDMEPNRARTRYLDKRAAVVAENKKITERNIATNAAIDKLNERLRAIDLELSPWYSFGRRYAPSFNTNKTAQGTIAEDKQASAQQSAFESDFLNPDSIHGLKHYLKSKAAALDDNLNDVGDNIKFIPGDGKLGDESAVSPVLNPPKFDGTDDRSVSGLRYATMPYAEIRRIAKGRNSRTTNAAINDFRTSLFGTTETFSTDPDLANYSENNLTKRYGFGDHGNPNLDRSNPYSKDGKNVIDYSIEKLKQSKHGLSNDPKFNGDKINAVDYIPSTDLNGIYPENTRDFITFYFSGIDLIGDGTKDDVVLFRATIKSITDSFNPSWSPISIMGRPDSPALYSSFDRSVNFDFSVAATSREELVPMWRKLNYLATFTMPVYGTNSRPQGPVMRITIGNMFKRVPGYISSLSYTVNDEATWDLADDLEVGVATANVGISNKSKSPKQLPNLIDVSVQYNIIHDYRAQKGGRVYSLYNGNTSPKDAPGNWLWDAKF